MCVRDLSANKGNSVDRKRGPEHPWNELWWEGVFLQRIGKVNNVKGGLGTPEWVRVVVNEDKGSKSM